MAWDDSKSNFETRDDIPDGEKLTAPEWNASVADQKNRGYNDLVTVTADHTADPQQVVLADASGGAVTVTLPAPESAATVTVKKIDGSTNAVTVARPGSETIDGDAADRTITGENVAREFTSDGSNYWII